MAMTRWLLLTLHIEIDPGCSLPKEEEEEVGVVGGKEVFLDAETKKANRRLTIS